MSVWLDGTDATGAGNGRIDAGQTCSVGTMKIKTSGLELVIVQVRLGLLGRALVLAGLEAFLVGQ